MEQAMKKFTAERIKCSVCQYGNNFEYRAMREGSQWYLGTFCPRPECGHCDDFKNVSYRVAQDYVTVKELK